MEKEFISTVGKIFLMAFVIYTNIAYSQIVISKKTMKTDVIDNYIYGSSSIYLTSNGKKTDSLTIYPIDFLIDSLVKINDTLYSYHYSIGYDTTFADLVVHEILFNIKNEQLNVIYVGVERHNSEFDPEIFNGGYSFLHTEKIDKIFGDSLLIYSYDSTLRIEVSNKYKDISVVCNSRNRIAEFSKIDLIYYNSIDTISGRVYFLSYFPPNGNYSQNLPKPWIIKELVVKTLKFNDVSFKKFAYIDGFWCMWYSFPDHSIIAPLYFKDNSKIIINTE